MQFIWVGSNEVDEVSDAMAYGIWLEDTYYGMLDGVSDLEATLSQMDAEDLPF